VQQAVHEAVRVLQVEGGREGLTVPAIAERAGVTPSTIYRRWGDLPQLLADVAMENLRPDGDPADTGTFRGDIETWLEQYLEEISSELGRALLRDVTCSNDPLTQGQCARWLKEQFDVMRARAEARGEPSPASETLMDRVVAPLIYRIVFAAETPDFAFAQGLLDQAMSGSPAAAIPGS
jgi:AcrR family transcriptional regulator